jgi:hypothetical protein
MNDLEHDLRQLFDRRASSIDTPGLPPKDVLRRARRRQVGTVVTGVLACVLALGVVAVALGQTPHPAVIPGDGNGLPERTTSIGSVPVTAPAGWTLVDDYPLASVSPTASESCSFSGTGTPVEGDGSSGEGDGSSSAGAVPSATPSGRGASGEGSSASGQTCTTENVDYAAGLPILQLANFQVPLLQTVCGLADPQPPAALPADGVAVYVADMNASAEVPALQSACPGSEDAPAGLPRFFNDAPHGAHFAAIGVAGPDASGADLAVARDYISSLSGGGRSGTTC